MPQRAPNGVVGVRDVIPTVRPPQGAGQSRGRQAHQDVTRALRDVGVNNHCVHI